jgi:hypothetical protein
LASFLILAARLARSLHEPLLRPGFRLEGVGPFIHALLNLLLQIVGLDDPFAGESMFEGICTRAFFSRPF